MTGDTRDSRRGDPASEGLPLATGDRLDTAGVKHTVGVQAHADSRFPASPVLARLLEDAGDGRSLPAGAAG